MISICFSSTQAHEYRALLPTKTSQVFSELDEQRCGTNRTNTLSVHTVVVGAEAAQLIHSAWQRSPRKKVRWFDSRQLVSRVFLQA